MPFSDAYRRQVDLLVRTIPFVAIERCFALKGGTAINLFIRDMPRLSVDIDLAYLPIADRTASLIAIDAAMGRIADAIGVSMPRARLTRVRIPGENYVNRLIVREDAAQIKIEVTPVLRGCVYEPTVRAVSASVEDQFGFAEIQVVSFADLFAGKIVAALDRQHPRDLFDVRDLLAKEGIDDELRKAFAVYLLSHNRPMAEVLSPVRLDIAAEFASGFAGMTAEPISAGELLQARESLIGAIVGGMPADHRRFLVSAKRGEPDWALLGLPHAKDLPAVRWRLENLAKLDQLRRANLLRGLRDVLGISEADETSA
jgi:predicted nucleotidyltransferase component of viral defense system